MQKPQLTDDDVTGMFLTGLGMFTAATILVCLIIYLIFQ